MRSILMGAFLALPLLALAQDIYEPNNSMSSAAQLPVGTLSNLSIHQVGDDDYFKFNLSAESQVVLSTSGVSGDSYLSLFDASGTLLAANDDYNGLWSRLSGNYGAGDYFVKVNEYGSNSTISSYSLTLAVAAPGAPTRSSFMSDLNLSYGFSSSGSYSTYFSNATSYTAVSKYGIVKPRMSGSYLYVDSLYQKYGADTIIVSASNAVGTAYDTVAVWVSAPTAPSRTYAVADQILEFGEISPTLYASFSGATSYAAVSKSGIVRPRMSGSTLYLDSVYNQQGVDTVIITASNFVGSATDTLLVTVLAPAVADAYESNNTLATATPLVDSIKNLSIHGNGLDEDYFRFSLGLDSYVQLSTRGVKGDTYMYLLDSNGNTLASSNDVSSSNKFSSVAVNRAKGNYYVSITENGSNLNISNYGLYLTATPLPAPSRYSTIADLSFSYGFGTAGSYSIYMNNAMQYTVQSLKGIVKPRLSSNYLYVDSLAGKYGVDTVIVTGSNTQGSVSDTIQVSVAAPTAPVRTNLMSDISQNFGFVSAGAYYTSFSGATSYTVISLKGIVKPRMSGSYLYVDSLAGKYGTDTLVIGASNAVGTTYDTVQFIVTPPLAADAYESNNTLATATPLSGTLNNLSIHNNGADMDYFVFNLTSDASIVLQTSGASGDTYLYLYDSLGVTLASNDDYTSGWSRIAGSYAAGKYYAKVQDYGANSNIADYSLSLSSTPLAAVVRSSTMPDLSLNFGFTSSAGTYSSFTNALRYAAVSTKGIVKARMSGSILYVDSVQGAYGVDTVIVSGINSSGTAYDTIQVTVAAPSAPVRYSAISDVSLNYGVTGNYYSTYFTGASSYSIQSLKGIIRPRMSGSYFYLDTTLGLWGVDTVIVTATNSVGSTSDTVQVTVVAPPQPVTLATPFADVYGNTLNVDSKFKLGNHFTNATNYTVNILKGSVCMDDDVDNSCYTSNFTLVASDTLWVRGSVYDTVQMEIVGSNSSYSARDTLLYILNSNVAPVLTTPLSDLTLNYGFNSYGQALSYTGATSYSARSLKGIVSARIAGSNLFVDSLAGKFGVDTVIVTASNSYGSTSDTLQVRVVNNALVVTQSSSLPAWTLSSTADLRSLNLDQYFNNATSYVVKVLSGTVCIDDQSTPSCTKTNFTLPGNTLYVGKISLGLAQVEITAGNSTSSVRDTLLVDLSALTALSKISGLQWERVRNSLNFHSTQDLQIELLNVRGQVIQKQRVSEPQFTLELPEAPGVYLLRIQTPTEHATLLMPVR